MAGNFPENAESVQEFSFFLRKEKRKAYLTTFTFYRLISKMKTKWQKQKNADSPLKLFMQAKGRGEKFNYFHNFPTEMTIRWLKTFQQMATRYENFHFLRKKKKPKNLLITFRAILPTGIQNIN